MIGVPLQTEDFTVNAPPKIDWSATKPSLTPTASVMMPESSFTASRAATSLPSGELAISTAAGEAEPTIWASTSAFGATG